MSGGAGGSSRGEDFRVYAPAERPMVQVEVDGQWWPGDLRMWSRREDGWWGQVSWTRAPGETLIDHFPAGRIRLDKTDYSRGKDPDAGWP